MWVGNVEELEECSSLSEFAKAQIRDFFRNNNVNSLPNGRHDLGEGNYVNIFEYETKENDGIFEAHKVYIDIHYAILGNEKILWADGYTKETKSYQKDGDYSLGIVENANEIVSNGNCCVFSPNEPHKAGVIFEVSEKVKKAVFKILATAIV